MIVHPVVLTDPREAACAHLRTAIVEGGASLPAVLDPLWDVWRDPVVAVALHRIWSDRRRLSRDHARIEQEVPHAS